MSSPVNTDNGKMKIIDVHSHFICKEYLDSVKKHGKENEDGFPTPSWSVDEHLSFMEKAGIDKSLISLSSPHFYFDNSEEAVLLGKTIDEYAASLKKAYPDKIMFATSLPVPDMDAAIKAVEYAYDELNADAVKLPSNACGVYPGDEKYDKLFEELNKRKAVVILHPTAPTAIPSGCFTAKPLPLFEFIADTTRAVINLIESGAAEKYPNVKIVVPHCGSFLPNVIDRLSGITSVLAAKGIGQAVDTKKSLENFYFDIAGDALPSGIKILLTLTDEDHILFGGDFPYTPSIRIEQKVRDLKANEEIKPILDKILYKNAERLFCGGSK